MSRLIALSLVVFAACGSSKPAATTTAPTKTEDSTADDQKLCVETFTHNRTCTTEYIPALVDTRAKLDLPPGIAAQVKEDRAGVIAKANAEWAADSTDASIASHCTQMTAHMTDDARALEAGVRGCLMKPDCAAYVACISPVEEQLMTHVSRQ